MLAPVAADLGHVTSAATLAALVPSVGVALAVAPLAGRRFRTATGVAAAATVSLALIIAVTVLGRVVGGVHEAPPPPWESFTSERAWRHVLVPDLDWWLNVALFAPAGAAWTLLTRRPGRVVVSLVALSVAIEAVQHVASVGHADPADVLTNSLGAGLGALLVTRGALRRFRSSAPA